MITGRCECGKVRFEADVVAETVTVCHCSQCRRISGHLWASTRAREDQIRFTEREGLEWYASSDFAERGFCRVCGSSLFYRMHDRPDIAIAAGCLDDTSGLFVEKHIFVKDKGAYYEIPEGEPQIVGF
ncbi:GFA family protein [Amorphus sp. 3PC139-8]|uniref:GFA family protein n=1 Tax=Amorphus sp. 3PC139-8 TaxID=2735676 RepID=UPI00345D16D8